MTGRDWALQLVGFLALSAVFFLGLYLANTAESISGPRVTGAHEPACVGSFVERAELLSDYPQRLERVRIVTFCRTDGWYRVIRATAMRVDGRVGQRFSNDTEVLCEQPRPEPENKATADMLREER